MNYKKLLLLLSVVVLAFIICGIKLWRTDRNQPQTDNNQVAAVESETVAGLPKKEFTNFDKGDVKKDNITKFIVKKTPQTEELLKNSDIVKQEPIDGEDSIAIEVRDANAADQIVNSIANAAGKDAIEQDAKLELYATYNDPYYSQQTNLTQMSMANGWAYLNNASSEKIAFVDTGVRGTHEDLTGRVIAGYNFLTGDAIGANTNSDDNGHGTAMASAASATANNAKGLVGVAYSAKIMPVKAFDEDGEGIASDAASGINWAANSGATVINLSFGSSIYSSAIHSAINHARGHGCIVVAAAGNSSRALSYPASDALTLSVGSVNRSNVRSSFSNTGSELDVMAPGESVIAAARTSNSAYTRTTGTSVSAAQVSGLVALARRWHSGASKNQVMAYIRQSASKPSGLGGATYNNDYGWGIINYTRLQTKVGDFHYSYVSQNGNPTMTSSGYNFRLTIKNTGESRWRRDIFTLGTARNHDRIPAFLREGGNPSGWMAPNRVQLASATVAPGSNTTISFWMKPSGSTPPNTYREYFQLVADGIGWMEDYGIYWNITVPSQYSYQYASQNGNPTLRKGRSYKFILRVKNTGQSTWRRNKVRLGTSRDHDRISSFLREGGNPSGWISGNRIQLKESSVAPNAYGTFEFYMKVPNNMPSGTYREYFQVVADGVGWLQDYGIYWTINVR